MIKKAKQKWDAIPITVKVSTAYTICSILQRCVSFITLPLFTRLLTTTEYGQYTVYSTWSAMIGLFLTLNLAYGSFSTAMIKFEDRREEYIASIQGICLALTVLFCALYIPFAQFWNKWLELPTAFVLLMVMEILCNTAISLWSGKKRFEYKYKSVIFVTLFTTVVAPAAALILVMNSDAKGYARILGYSLTYIAVGGSFFVFNILKAKKIYTKEFWIYALKFNIPLLAYYFSQLIFNQSDKLMISHYCGQDKSAMYGVAYNFAVILTFVLNAINSSYVPWFYEKLKKNQQKENITVSCFIAILLGVLLLGIIWFAPEIIMIMAGNEYKEAIGVVPPVAISLLLLFYSQLFINVEFYFEEKHLLVIASIGAALVNIALNAWLIPVLGFVAAGYTTLFSYIIFALSNYLVMNKVLKKHGITEKCYNEKYLIAILAAFMLISFIGVFLYQWLIARIMVALIVFVIILKNYQKIMGFIKIFRNK